MLLERDLLFFLRINVKINFCRKFLALNVFPHWNAAMVRSLGSNAAFAFPELGGEGANAWVLFVLFCIVLLNLVCIYIGLLYSR